MENTIELKKEQKQKRESKINSTFNPLRKSPLKAPLSPQDTLVIFGEVFQNGYVNGLIREAKKEGLQIIYSTVGRRTNDLTLRPLNEEELKEKEGPFINIPLEAGFDLEISSKKKSPVDLLKEITLKNWDNKNSLDWDQIEESRKKGVKRFREATKKYIQELEKILQKKEGRVFIVHTMAGGFPRAKIVMPIANRVFKGFKKRYLSSKHFWSSDIGKLCQISFNEVTAESFYHLIDLTSELRNKLKKQKRHIRYLAYGYHGTEVLIENQYQWQSYSPYLQGWAKLNLENIAKRAWDQGVKATVYNSPEILTSSSHIFLGVEVSLYPLLGAILKENQNSKMKEKTLNSSNLLKECKNLLKEPYEIEDILKKTNNYLHSETIKRWSLFDQWPQHNGPEQMKLMREKSSELIDMHKDKKNLITQKLSELVFSCSGKIMLHHSWDPQNPVLWLGHDVIAKTFVHS